MKKTEIQGRIQRKRGWVFDLTCPTCREIDDAEASTLQIPFHEDEIYRGECSEKHPFTFLMTTPKYKLLSELAAIQFAEDFPTAAALSIHSAFENFKDRYIRAACVEHNDEEIEELMNRLKLSERQFGAFEIAYLFKTGKLAPKVDDEAHQTTLRNRIVHGGRQLSFEEGIGFAHARLQFICRCHDESKTVLDAYHSREIEKRDKKYASQYRNLRQCSTWTLIDDLCGNFEDLKTAIARRRQLRD